MDSLLHVAERFSTGRVVAVHEFGNGNINNTFLVTLDAGGGHFILQRVNTKVFSRPDLVMRNMRTCAEHVRQRLEQTPLAADSRWEIPEVLFARDGDDHWIAPDGSFWRALSFIESAHSFDTIRDVGHAHEVGSALGTFHSLLSDLPGDSLSDTLEGFHITPLYLNHYRNVLARGGSRKSPEVNYCLRFVSERTALTHVLEDARAQGRLLPRPIHGDPKVNNIMIDTNTGRAVSIVDLDTVKPGLVHYDIGDCLRSGCNRPGEDMEQWERVHFETDLCEAILRGYLPTAREFLTENDFDFIYDSIRLIAFELGLRFFTDYLEGDVYFKVRHRGHNLARALVQFKLTESIESQEKAIRSIIREA